MRLGWLAAPVEFMKFVEKFDSKSSRQLQRAPVSRNTRAHSTQWRHRGLTVRPARHRYVRKAVLMCGHVNQ